MPGVSVKAFYARIGYHVLNGVVVTLLAVGGLLKILDHRLFIKGIENAALIPDWLIPGVAVYVPWFEVTVGLSMLSRELAKGGRALAALFFFLICIYSVAGLVLRRPYTCACVGKFDIGPWQNHIAIAVAGLVLLIVIEALSKRSEYSVAELHRSA